MRLRDKVVIVTGAAQGMGEATAQLFVAEGASVVVADVQVAEGEAVADRIGEGARFARLDVAEEESWAELVAGTMERYGRIDGLVNNAAIFFAAPIDKVKPAKFRELIDIDLYGPWLGMRAVIPPMRAARRGSIVNISSVEGLMGHCDHSAYAAAKWGLRGMSKSVALEVGPFGVRVNTVQPGAIDTPMLRAGMDVLQRPFDAVFPEVSMNRPGDPVEIARANLFLVSDEASYVNGADLTVDGGWTCGQYRFNKPGLAGA